MLQNHRDIRHAHFHFNRDRMLTISRSASFVSRLLPELRVDRRVRADLAADLSSPAFDLSSGVLAERMIYVWR